LSEGEAIVLWNIAANRDESVFDRSEEFNIYRSPNRHLAFSSGEHYCLGSALARLEMRVLFEELFGAVKDIRAAGPAKRLRSTFIAGITELPVTLSPR
jgi:cytochrome P450